MIIMAVPTISSISHAFGHTGGRQYIEVSGTNFRPQTPQVNPSGPLPVPPPSVAVEFGGIISPKVLITSTTRVIALTGERDEGSDLDVIVRNIDDAGVLIPGEEATLAGAYNYRAALLAVDSPLTLIAQQLILSIRRQVHPRATISVHTDLDESAATLLNVARISALPAIVLIGPNTVKSAAAYQSNENFLTEDTPNAEEFASKQSLESYDVSFDLLLLSNNKDEYMNMIEAMIGYHRKTKHFIHPSTGSLIELRLVAAPQTQPRPGNDNLFVARAEIALIGFELGEFPGFASDSVLELGRKTLDGDAWCELQDTTQLGQTYRVGTITFEPAIQAAPFPTPQVSPGSNRKG